MPAIRDVFIVMPFSEQRFTTSDGESRKYTTEHFSDVYAVLKESVKEYDATIRVDRMEQRYGNLVTAIIERLASADMVIAVLAGRNPNVFYELGVRHSLRLNTIMLVENRDEYPFDLTAYFSHEYSVEHDSDRKALKEFVKGRLYELSRQTLMDSPVLDVLRRGEFEQFRVLNAWETRRAAMVLDGLLREVNRVAHALTPLFSHAVQRSTAPTEPTAFLPQLRLSWNMIDGFTKTRPIPGLSRLAYEDAEAVYYAWRRTIAKCNEMISYEADPEELQGLIVGALYGTLGFLHDVLTALDFVITTRRAYGIPWLGSAEKVCELITDFGTLAAAIVLMNERTESTSERFAEFERAFLGLPKDMIAGDANLPEWPTIENFAADARRRMQDTNTNSDPSPA